MGGTGHARQLRAPGEGVGQATDGPLRHGDRSPQVRGLPRLHRGLQRRVGRARRPRPDPRADDAARRDVPEPRVEPLRRAVQPLRPPSLRRRPVRRARRTRTPTASSASTRTSASAAASAWTPAPTTRVTSAPRPRRSTSATSARRASSAARSRPAWPPAPPTPSTSATSRTAPSDVSTGWSSHEGARRIEIARRRRRPERLLPRQARAPRPRGDELPAAAAAARPRPARPGGSLSSRSSLAVVGLDASSARPSRSSRQLWQRGEGL